MKKFISLLLALAMILSVAFTVASCRVDPELDEPSETEAKTTRRDYEDDDDEDYDGPGVDWESIIGKTEVTTEPEVEDDPEGYTLEVFGDIQFLYPTVFRVVVDNDSMFQVNDPETGSSMLLMLEAATGIYEKMSTQIYEKMLRPTYEQMNFVVSDVLVERKTNGKGLDLTIISQTLTREGDESEIDMVVKQVFVTVGNYSYGFTLGHIDEEISEVIFESIDYKNSTPPQGAVRAGTYTLGELSIDYPAGWLLSNNQITEIVLGDATNRVEISISGRGSESLDDINMNKYDEEIRPTYESLGYTVESVSINKATNSNGVQYAVIEQTLIIVDFELKINQYFIIGTENSYIISFYNADSSVESAMVNSIRIAN